LRIVHHFIGLPGASIGLTAHRLWDETGPVTTSDGGVSYAGLTPSLPGDAYGPVTDTVFGIDFQTPIAIVRGGAARAPTLFGEVATSRYTPDTLTIAPMTDSGGIAGLHFMLGAIKGTAEYQAIGMNYLDGAPFRYFGNAPATWADYQGAAFPQFFGFANTLVMNRAYDASINATMPGSSATASSSALTFLYPVFNPFVASGPDFFSDFAPNTQGATLSLSGPVEIAGLAIVAHLSAQHLTEAQANANAMSTFGPQFASSVRARWDSIVAGGSVGVPFFGRKATLDVSGTYEHLGRDDRTTQGYLPIDPAVGPIVPVAPSNVVYAPNFASISHVSIDAGIAWPVARDLVLSTRLSDQHYYGAYATTLENNIGGTKDQIDLTLRYTVPNTTSSVGVGYRLSSYKDVQLPSYNFVQSQENVNYSFHF
jgi:hypothetical protein